MLEFGEGAGVVALPVIEILRERKMSFRQVRVERVRSLQGILSLGQPAGRVIESLLQ